MAASPARRPLRARRLAAVCLCVALVAVVGIGLAGGTATAQGGQQRNPDNLVAPSALAYQEEPKDGQQCSGCQFYIPDQNGDGMGACTLITGTVDPQGWCNSYSPYETASQ